MGKEYELRLRPAEHVFETPLTEGIILERPNRFIMIVQINGPDHRRVVQAHCPNTGKIGSVRFHNVPVLLSYHGGVPGRRFDWTAEAISYDRPSDKHKAWIGINTGATNRYVETFLKHGMFGDMVSVTVPTAVHREQKLGKSRIDFRVKDTFIEVKTWTQIIEKKVPSHLELREVKDHSYSGSDRLVKHSHELAEALRSHQRCIMLGCYQYVPDEDYGPVDYGSLYADTDEIVTAFDAAHAAGVESWTCTMDIDPRRVKLVRYWRDR